MDAAMAQHEGCNYEMYELFSDSVGHYSEGAET
ncbi:Uncharacterised protein [Yersinia frederiksenii]|nr:Uncharacterised protein [Yersinia frederiksenii]